MKVAVIDADFISGKKHRFPNLSCMKISGYHKARGDDVFLKMSWDGLGEDADMTYIAKVFTDTPIPKDFYKLYGENQRIRYGGTGFFFDRAAPLRKQIEHTMPDYDLYKGIDGRFYTDYSIGFLTRGCFRHCQFCVNQKSPGAVIWSPLEEFHDARRKKLCFLDDNFLSIKEWEPILRGVIETGKPYRFHQGLDARLLNEEKCRLLFHESVYDGDFTFAFDDIRDKKSIEEKMELIKHFNDGSRVRWYVLCGFKGTDNKDICELLERVVTIGDHGMLPYVMRYASDCWTPWRSSRWRHLYVGIARWVNQPSFFKKMSFYEFCERDQKYIKGDRECASLAALRKFCEEQPELGKKYFYQRLYKR